MLFAEEEYTGIQTISVHPRNLEVLERLFFSPLYLLTHACAPSNQFLNTQVIGLNSLIVCVPNVYVCVVCLNRN